MEIVMAVVKWVQSNWVNLITIYTALVTCASVIVKITPTLKDDNILLGIVKFLGKYIALNKTVDEADRPK